MLARLLLLFIIVPMVELFLLIELGRWIGTIPTLLLIIVTGFLGAFLVRRQGIQVLGRIRGEFSQGRLPADSIFDGALILLACAFLMTPGILTDVVGFSCRSPATRQLFKAVLLSRLQKAVENGQIVTVTHWQRTTPTRPEPDNVIIIDPDDTPKNQSR